MDVSKDSIKPLVKGPLPDGQYWIYTTLSDRSCPSKQFPIVQSYVDVFLSGCFELEKKCKLNGVAKDCINTTKNWSGSWVNDRVHPRRAWEDIPYAMEVDALIAKMLPQYFRLIKIE